MRHDEVQRCRPGRAVGLVERSDHTSTKPLPDWARENAEEAIGWIGSNPRFFVGIRGEPVARDYGRPMHSGRVPRCAVGAGVAGCSRVHTG